MSEECNHIIHMLGSAVFCRVVYWDLVMCVLNCAVQGWVRMCCAVLCCRILIRSLLGCAVLSAAGLRVLGEKGGGGCKPFCRLLLPVLELGWLVCTVGHIN